MSSVLRKFRTFGVGTEVKAKNDIRYCHSQFSPVALGEFFPTKNFRYALYGAITLCPLTPQTKVGFFVAKK